jgi:hypothetical protein
LVGGLVVLLVPVVEFAGGGPYGCVVLVVGLVVLLAPVVEFAGGGPCGGPYGYVPLAGGGP